MKGLWVCIGLPSDILCDAKKKEVNLCTRIKRQAGALSGGVKRAAKRGVMYDTCRVARRVFWVAKGYNEGRNGRCWAKRFSEASAEKNERGVKVMYSI